MSVEMTLATGTVTYAGDPESDERIASREVRVSVTYRIEDEEMNLAAFAYDKMAEVERARLAAWERLGHGPVEATASLFDAKDASFDADDAPFDPGAPGLDPPDDEANDGDEQPDDDGEYPDAPRQAAGSGCRCHLAQSGNASGHGEKHVFHAPAFATEMECAAEPSKLSPAETDWASKPQVLAIDSHFRRLGIGPADQTALLRARFGKFRPERLTKMETAQLMRSLERGELEPEGAAVDSAEQRHRVPASA